MSPGHVVADLESTGEKVVGELCEGKPHVRFEVAGDGNRDMVEVLRHSQRKRRANWAAPPKF
jgi:hypothetical protein